MKIVISILALSIQVLSVLLLTVNINHYFTLSCLLHLCSCAVLAIVLGRYITSEQRLISYPYVFGTCLAIPVMGAMIVISVIIFQKFIPEYAKYELAYLVGDPLDQIEFSKQFKEQESRQQSILSVLNNGNNSERRKAILSLGLLHGAPVIKLLKRAVRDSDEYVRAYAQTLLQSFTNEIETKLKNLKKELEQDPTSIRTMQKTVECMESMLTLGLVASENQIKNKEKILQILLDILQIQPSNPDVLHKAFKYALELDHLPRAEELWNQLSSLNYNNPTLISSYLNLLFLKRNWTEYYSTLHRYTDAIGPAKPIIDPQLQQLKSFWLREIPST
ncbi:MAG: hypothetical protein AAGA18_06635 [Verrucomicrobiota bacterium]